MKPKSKNQKKSGPIFLTPAQLKSRQSQLLVIDGRGWLEYWMGHIPGARRLGRNRILKEIPKDQKIVITCLSGHRSEVLARWLVAQGYQQVHNLAGGLLAWRQAGYAVQSGTRP